MLCDLIERPRPALLHQQAEEVHLEEHVAELVEQLGVIASAGCVGQLVGLLERVGHDRALVLLAIPRALNAQAPSQLVEAVDCFTHSGDSAKQVTGMRARLRRLLDEGEAFVRR